MPDAFAQLGVMHHQGLWLPSHRRARERIREALDLGCAAAQSAMNTVTSDIAVVSGETCHARLTHFQPLVPFARDDRVLIAALQGLSPLLLAPQTLMDQRIELFGLSRQHMVGKRGVAYDYHVFGGFGDRTKDKITVRMGGGKTGNPCATAVALQTSHPRPPVGPQVKLDTGETFRVKPANVRIEDWAEVAPLLDSRVEVCGGTHECDGQRGIVTQYFPTWSEQPAGGWDGVAPLPPWDGIPR